MCESFKPASKVPAFLHVVDIAGLVRGAHEGQVLYLPLFVIIIIIIIITILFLVVFLYQGLGNAFLSHISACDAIFHCISKYALAYN